MDKNIACGCSLSAAPSSQQKEEKKDDVSPENTILVINESPTELIWFLPEASDKYILIAPGQQHTMPIRPEGLADLPDFFVSHLQKGIIKNTCLVPHHRIRIHLKDCNDESLRITSGAKLRFYRLLNFGEGGCRISLQNKDAQEIPIAADIELIGENILKK